MEYSQSKEVKDVCEYHTAIPAVPSSWTAIPLRASSESWTDPAGPRQSLPDPAI